MTKIKRSIYGLTLLLLLVALGGISGCKTPPDPTQQTDSGAASSKKLEADKAAKKQKLAKSGEQKIDKTENKAPAVQISQVTDLSRDNREFAFDLYQTLTKGNAASNIFLSPHSISVALAMTYAGARGDTAAQIAETMHFGFHQEQLHPTFHALNLALSPKSQLSAGSLPFVMVSVNAIWGQKGHKFLPAYLDLISANYGAGVHRVDFKAQPEAARQRINTWVAERTHERIKNLLGTGALNAATRLILTNAVYFQANWLNNFNKNATKEAGFIVSTDSKVKVHMMQNQGNFMYASVDGHQVIELPYIGNQVAMVVVLPAEGKFEAVESSLTADLFDKWVNALSKQYGTLALPRFTFKSDFTLSQPLKAMGMELPFSSKADFSGIDGSKGLSIDDVIHKAFVAVDEEGTEAAAATAVVMRAMSARFPPKKTFKMTVNRPFFVFIRNKPTGELLFMGRVMDPS